jgi:hypothetical protein
MDGVVDSPRSVHVTRRVQRERERKRQHKLFPDESEPEHRVKQDDDGAGDDKCENGENDLHTHIVSAPVPVLLDA